MKSYRVLTKTTTPYETLPAIGPSKLKEWGIRLKTDGQSRIIATIEGKKRQAAWPLVGAIWMRWILLNPQTSQGIQNAWENARVRT